MTRIQWKGIRGVDILYVISQMVNLLNIPMCIYNSCLGILFRPGQDNGNRTLSSKEKDVIGKLFRFEEQTSPVINHIDENVFYVTIHTKETEKEWILAGPVLIQPCRQEQFEKTKEKFWELSEIGFEICQSKMESFLSGVFLIYYFVSGQKLDSMQLLEKNQEKFSSVMQMKSKLSQNIFERQEKQRAHNPYSQELRELESIENGDIEALNRSISETYEGEIGMLAKSPLRHHKNVAIGNITMASRAAVRGGISVELAFSMADSFIQQIEEIDDIAEVEMFKRASQRAYATIVHEQKHDNKNQNNPLVEGVKNYIFSHLHENIKIDEIAASLHVNADYLSHLFSNHEGVTIKRYILQEKVCRSKNLLCYSDFSLQEIAFYLGFSTQSYFTKIFREFVGMTPGDYRKKLKKRDFF